MRGDGLSFDYQQRLVLPSHRPWRRPTAADKLFWVLVRSLWARWKTTTNSMWPPAKKRDRS